MSTPEYTDAQLDQILMRLQDGSLGFALDQNCPFLRCRLRQKSILNVIKPGASPPKSEYLWISLLMDYGDIAGTLAGMLLETEDGLSDLVKAYGPEGGSGGFEEVRDEIKMGLYRFAIHCVMEAFTRNDANAFTQIAKFLKHRKNGGQPTDFKVLRARRGKPAAEAQPHSLPAIFTVLWVKAANKLFEFDMRPGVSWMEAKPAKCISRSYIRAEDLIRAANAELDKIAEESDTGKSNISKGSLRVWLRKNKLNDFVHFEQKKRERGPVKRSTLRRKRQP